MTFVRMCFDDRPSLDFDEITGLWPNGWLWPNDQMTTFVKKVFELDDLFKFKLNYFQTINLLLYFIHKDIKLNNFCKRSFFD